MGNKNMSAFQRRSMTLFGCSMVFFAVLSGFAWNEARLAHSPTIVSFLLAIVPAFPVVAIMVVAGRYFARETDEYLKSLVIQALLWGFGITLVTDVVLGGLSAYFPPLGTLLPLFSIDLSCVAAMVALRIQLWRGR